MTKRDILLAALNHEQGEIPSWTMAFFNINLAKTLLGDDNVPTDYLPTNEYKTGRADDENRQRNINYSIAVDNYAIAVGKGGNFAFGHGGPGEFMDKIISENDNEIISMFETGVKKLVKKNPHFYHHYDYPLDDLSNAHSLILPNTADEQRYIGIEQDVAFYKEKGYLPYANLNGIFSGIHYFLYPYDKLFMDMILDKENLKIIIKKLSHANLCAAQNMLKKGVEMITTCDDLGDGNSSLFSPEFYCDYFYDYHCELADLCHSYGAYLHLHSHGNIKKLLPHLVKANIDIINPFDPFEMGDISEIKDLYGTKITIAGGMHKFFFEMSKEEQYKQLKSAIGYMGKGGGYIFMDNGGIPEGVTKETYDYYRNTSKQLRSVFIK